MLPLPSYLRSDVAIEERREDVALQAGAPDEVAIMMILVDERSLLFIVNMTLVKY